MCNCKNILLVQTKKFYVLEIVSSICLNCDDGETDDEDMSIDSDNDMSIDSD